MAEKLFVLKGMVQAAFGYSATLVLAAVCFLSGPPVNAECPDEPPEPPYRLFVKPEATGDAGGQDWANAAVLQDALECAAAAGVDTEIWGRGGEPACPAPSATGTGRRSGCGPRTVHSVDGWSSVEYHQRETRGKH